MTSYMEHKDLSNTDISEARAQEIRAGVASTVEALHNALDRAGRHDSDATLLAATKTRDVAEILTAIDAGIRCIGENRPQEILAKAEGLQRGLEQRSLDVPLHMIGQLQANKISKILPYTAVIESVDSLKLAERIARRVENDSTVDVFLEVNVSGEESKSGCHLHEARDLAHEISALGTIRITGLMTIGAHVHDEKIVRAGFENLRNMRDTLQSEGLTACTELSMGMSADMEWAVAEGSTIVRVGTGIFGERAFI